MLCACEIPSRDPRSGSSHVTWPSELLQAPGHREGSAFCRARAARLRNGAHKDVCGPMLPGLSFMHAAGLGSPSTDTEFYLGF